MLRVVGVVDVHGCEYGGEMSEMIEIVARALFERREEFRAEQYTSYGRLSWAESPEHWKQELRGDARAAIAAMRDPTEAMIDTAFEDLHPIHVLVWYKMIDEALK